ncbi:ADP-ribosylation/Crystallin J1 [Mycena maculata]|uniref:ADP-ribosylhydrolase ARH3 n=1 Tax=Mycena maculata TaxID=230809 RepID=A0AAD7JE10_9AGAR|nr:ADP-ribosylation/Crystallin J1 [Mycena maculata]
MTTLPPLHTQHPVPAPAPTKIRLALLATALCDALGAPAEFCARASFAFLSTMAPNENFGLGPGVWTDDTSMALALARSLATCSGGEGASTPTTGGARGGFDAADQLDAYFRWWQDGALSATGECFDIGTTICRALGIYRDALRAAGVAPQTQTQTQVGTTAQEAPRRAAAETALARIARDLRGAGFGGNGSLMRVLPVALAYHRAPAAAAEYARRSSAPTHPNAVCGEACAAWAACVARVVAGASAGPGPGGAGGEGRMTKLDVLHHFAAYPWSADAGALRAALAPDVPLPAGVAAPAAVEAHYAAHHRLMRLRAAARVPPSPSPEAHTRALLPPAAALPSSGYVVHTLAAALYAFLATASFEAGALLAANMGDDADTVGAVYGGLAGAWYAAEDVGGGEGGLFWSPRVRAWRDALVRRDVIEEVAEELVGFAGRQA